MTTSLPRRPKRRLPAALTVAGLDPCGGAGIIADARTFEAFNIHPMAVAASLTFQSTQGVTGRFDVPGSAVRSQLKALLEDRKPNALKTGMLATADNIRVVAAAVEEYVLGPLVVDPVLTASDGSELLDAGAVRILLRDLVPLAALVTPNLAELAALTGLPLGDFEDAKTGALKIAKDNPCSVLVTGVPYEEGGVAMAADILCDGDEFKVFTTPWVEEWKIHGTGCVLSAAICACGALGMDLEPAIEAGRRFVLRASECAVYPGAGLPCANPRAVDVRKATARPARDKRTG